MYSARNVIFHFKKIILGYVFGDAIVFYGIPTKSVTHLKSDRRQDVHDGHNILHNLVVK